MKRLLALAAFQVFVILGWAAYHEAVWATAPTFRIPLRPRDPFDPLRGRYFVLNPQDSAIATGSSPLTATEVGRFLGSATSFEGGAQVGFCPEEDVYRICALRRLHEDGGEPARFWSRAFVTVVPRPPGWSLRVDLGLNRFFIPNRSQLPARENEPGWQLEVCHRPGLSPLARRLFFRGQAVELR